MNKSLKQTKSIPLIHIVIRIRKTKRNRQHNGQKKKIQKDKQQSTKEEFEDNKGVIRIRKSKKIRQHNDQKTKGQTTTYKIVQRKRKIE